MKAHVTEGKLEISRPPSEVHVHVPREVRVYLRQTRLPLCKNNIIIRNFIPRRYNTQSKIYFIFCQWET